MVYAWIFYSGGELVNHFSSDIEKPDIVEFSNFHDVHLQAAMWCQLVHKISENLVGVAILELSPEYHHSILVAYV